VDEQHPLYQEAFNVARHLAYDNKVIINGGGPGVMDAATKGAQAGAGKTIGVTFYPEDMPEFEGRFYKNIVDTEIKTANYIERMFGLMQYSDAFICFQGGTGTLSEWATAWLLAHLYYGHHKPIVLYGGFWTEVMEVMAKHFFIGEKEQKVYKIVNDVDGVVRALREFEEELFQTCGLPREGEGNGDQQGVSQSMENSAQDDESHFNAQSGITGSLAEASKYAL
jgi:uncharacterized protein (TIGR00725 family)